MGQRATIAALVVAVLVVLVVLVDHQPTTTSGVSSSPPGPAPAVTVGSWVLGARPLPLRSDGYGQVLATPPELVDRRVPTVDVLAAPASGRYESTISVLTPEMVARSTWRPGCPVPPERLRYLTMAFWGFDDRPHTGEMIVRDDVAADVVGVFGRLFAARFPIEQMHVITPADLKARATGDGNNTAAYACRTATGQTRFSAHASGLAIDVNPFQNPLQRTDGLVIPELASAYTRRDDVRPGMIERGDAVVRAFAAIGWTWGATFTAPKDTMHFSATGD